MDIGHTVRSVTRGIPTLLTGGIPGERAGDDRLAWNTIISPETIRVTSTAFEDGSPIPQTYTADGAGISPPVAWSNLPPETRFVALLVEDPDAPTPEPFVHWIVSMPVTSREASLAENASENPTDGSMLQGINSMLKRGYIGCAPPKGDLPHHYHFQLFALGEAPEFRDGVGRTALIKEVSAKVLAKGGMVGTYQR